MEYVRSQVLSMKASADHTERWLQDRIAEDPGLLGLGEVEVRDQERRQPSGGRLDMLLVEPETRTRYEVELQLGPTDETHIIRTIEYWDVERRRYPTYDHVAVIVAEDITSRFLNVISLFNRAVPLIAIQIQALTVGDATTLHATRVLDLTMLRAEDDDEPGETTDRAFWEKNSTKQMLSLTDELVKLTNEVTGGAYEPKYNKFYIGQTRNGLVDNFLIYRPRKGYVVIEPRIERSDELSARIDELGLESLRYDTTWNRYRLRLTRDDLANHRDLLEDLIRLAAGLPTQPGDDVDA